MYFSRFHMTDAQCTLFCTHWVSARMWGAVQWISNQIQSPRLVTAQTLPSGDAGTQRGNIKRKMVHNHLQNAVCTFCHTKRLDTWENPNFEIYQIRNRYIWIIKDTTMYSMFIYDEAFLFILSFSREMINWHHKYVSEIIYKRFILFMSPRHCLRQYLPKR